MFYKQQNISPSKEKKASKALPENSVFQSKLWYLRAFNSQDLGLVKLNYISSCLKAFINGCHSKNTVMFKVI